MRCYLVAAASSLFLLSGCASPAPSNAAVAGPGQPSDQESLNCRVEGLLLQDLARLRDAGQPTRVAVNRVHTQYQGLVSSLDERSAVDAALAHRDASAKFVYAHAALQPATLRYLGSSNCLMAVAGNRDQNKAIALTKSAEGCQKQFPPQSAEAQLRSCIASAAVQPPP